MKSRSEIWLSALEELGAQCSVSTTRDAETLARRVAQEGDTFFKVTLPQFGKDFERSLADGCIPAALFKGFKRRTRKILIRDEDFEYDVMKAKKHGGGNPLFLGGFLDLVFCDEVETTWEDYDMVMRYAQNESPVQFHFLPLLRPLPAAENGVAERMADAIAAIRQLCLMFGKEKELCSDSRIQAAVESYVEVDKELDAPFTTQE